MKMSFAGLYVAWKGIDTDQRLFWAGNANVDAANSWTSGHIRGDFNTSQGPALAVFNNRLYMVWKGVEGDQHLYLASSTNPDDPGNWAFGQMNASLNTSQGPALAVFNNRLYMAWKGVEGDQRLFWASSTNPDNPNSWGSGAMSPAFNTSQGPALIGVPQVNSGTGNEGTGNEGTGNEGTGNEGTGDEGTGDEGTGDEGTGDEGDDTGDEGGDTGDEEKLHVGSAHPKNQQWEGHAV
jgi:hypothetical protein